MCTCKKATFTSQCRTDICPSLTSEGPFIKYPQDIENESELDFHLLLPQTAAPLLLERQFVQKSVCPLRGDSCAVSHFRAPGLWGNVETRRPRG